MLFRWIALALILISQNIAAYEFPIVVTEYLDDIKLVASINESDIDKTLTWDPASGSPPLTLVDALSAVRKHIAAGEGESAADLLEIELKQIPHHVQQWHYLVKMRTTNDDEMIIRYFVVLMNAKVIPALPIPESVR